MMTKDKEEKIFSTNLRIPKHLQHKLNILSDSDDRSFNGYVIKVLQDHVIEFEKSMANEYGIREFFKMHDTIFGKEFTPYYNEDALNSDTEQTKTIVKNIMRGTQRTPKNSNIGTRNITQDAEVNDIE